MAQSLYEVLGVQKDASADAIRSAYRKLAKKHHPDVNPDKKSEEKFKSITAAYDVLSDEKRRAAYDEFGDIALQTGFDPAKAREHARWQSAQRQARQHVPQHDAEHAGWGGMGFDIEDLLGRVGRSRGPMKGSDLSATIQIDLRQAIEGAEFSGELPGHGLVRVRIPPGADTGSTLRVPGKGAPGPNGGPAGDLVLEIELRPHPLLRRDGLDLYMPLPVTLDEAYNGATIDVPTFEGPIALKIPPRSQNGAKMRVRGRGVPKKGTRGDLYVELDVRMPDKQDDALAAAVKGALYSSPVRSKTTID